MRWEFIDSDGKHPSLVVLHEDELDAVEGLAPELVIVECKHGNTVQCRWHLEDGTFLGMARRGEC